MNIPQDTLDALDAAVAGLREDPIHRDMTRTALILVGIELAIGKYGPK